jgi:ParB-like chromosome segregation protein Spo0J
MTDVAAEIEALRAALAEAGARADANAAEAAAKPRRRRLTPRRWCLVARR